MGVIGVLDYKITKKNPKNLSIYRFICNFAVLY